jgi:hypothetical protein
MKRVRLSSKLSNSLQERVNSYALAAGAAGVGMLALAHPAEAKIVYTPAQITIGWLGRYSIDLRHDGGEDFAIRNLTYNSTSPFGDVLAASALRGGNGIERSQASHFAAALPKGVRVGPSVKNFREGRKWMLSCDSAPHTSGPWVNVTNRFLGLKVLVHGKVHYGWARLTVRIQHPQQQPPAITTVLTGYAYETVPNKPIMTGKERDGDDSVTLGRLALGR